MTSSKSSSEQSPDTQETKTENTTHELCYIASLKSMKQSQVYLPNEIEDDFGASAVSMALTSSVITSFKHNNSTICHDEYQNSSAKKPKKKLNQAASAASFQLDSTQRNDLENSMLFKQRKYPRCPNQLQKELLQGK